MSQHHDEQLRAIPKSASPSGAVQSRETPRKPRIRRDALRRWSLLPLAVAGSLLVSGQSVPRASSPAAVETHEAMTTWINPAAIAIWDVVANAKSETEGLDPQLMDGAAWTKIQQAARSLERHSNRMAHSRILRVGHHTAEQAGFANRAEIQTRIDATPQWFRAMSRTMAEQAGALSRAAAARDTRTTRDLVEGMSDQCQGCHTRYWAKPVS
jgi:hypothetical protein